MLSIPRGCMRNWQWAVCAVVVVAVFVVQLSFFCRVLDADTDDSVDKLALRQEQIADKYIRLETLLLRMADVDANTQPRRAAILRRAVAQCNERHVRHQLDLLVRMLTEEDLDRALDRQKNVRQDFHALLELLLKEGRSKRLQDEQARLHNYVKELERLLRRQIGLQARTEGGDSIQTLSEQQQQLSQRTGKLGQQMRENEEQSAKREPHDAANDDEPAGPSEGKEGDGKEGDGKEGDGKEGDGKEGDGKEGDGKEGDGKEGDGKEGDGKEGDGKEGDGENNSSADGEPSESQGGQGPSQEGSEGNGGGQPGQPSAAPPSQSFPPRQRVEEARRRMQEALKKLQAEQPGEATKEQQRAQDELRKAIAQLEEILRQSREEEVERMLALLESRFRKMLQMQVNVYEETQLLDEAAEDQRGFEFDIQAGKLGFEQRKIVVEADRALTLLQDEGSSIAFPEVVGQARDDMQQVAERLAASKPDAVTQGIEQDIIAALKEMIDALQREQKRRDDKPPGPRPPGNGSPDDEALVDALAELRMIRSMENRIYERTKRYAGMLDDVDDPAGQADDPELSTAIRRLGKRQQRVQQITRDLVLGKNR